MTFEVLAATEQAWPPGIGRLQSIAHDAKRGVVAFIGNFDWLYWPGRAFYHGHRLRHRVSLFRSADRRRIAIFDRARYPINDIAFHPKEPILAVATGSYDGGDAFEGELLLWNWETDEVWRPLTEEREVARCRFVDAGALAVVLRPWNDAEEGAFERHFGYVLRDLRAIGEVGLAAGGPDPRLEGVAPRSAEELGFEPPEAQTAASEALRRSLGMADDRAQRMWDVAWLGDSVIAGAHDGCRVELWRSDGRGLLRETGEGNGVQLFPRENGLIVHVAHRAKLHGGTSGATSELFALSGKELRPLRAFDRAYAFSMDARGRMLGRDAGDPYARRDRADVVLALDATTLHAGDFGQYDCFNHYLRIDGQPALHFLRGTPRSSHKNKWLCAIGPDGEAREVMPWDPEVGHFMYGTACALPDGSFAIGYYVHDPRPGKGPAYVERRAATAGTAWRFEVPRAPIALAHARSIGAILAASLDGRLRAIDEATGALIGETDATLDGAPTAITSLSVREDRLAAGTLDGRAIIFRLRRDRG